MLLVLDASVVVKWFKDETNSSLALNIREDFYNGTHEIMVPDLILYEISNALRFDKKFTPELIKESIKSLFEMDIIITVPSGNMISEAVKLAYDKNITVYDAVYILLSLRSNGIFITADEILFKKIKGLKNCRLLSHIQPL